MRTFALSGVLMAAVFIGVALVGGLSAGATLGYAALIIVMAPLWVGFALGAASEAMSGHREPAGKPWDRVDSELYQSPRMPWDGGVR